MHSHPMLNHLFSRVLPTVLLGVVAGMPACTCDAFLSGTTGTLEVTVTNVPATTPVIQVTVRSDAVLTDMAVPSVQPETVVTVKDLESADYAIRVVALDQDGRPVTAVWVSDVFIRSEQTTRIQVDLGAGILITGEICDGLDNDHDGRVDEPLNMPLCTECRDGFEQLLPDDDRCGVVDCSVLDRAELRGENTATGTSTCVAVTHADLTSQRCVARGQCAAAGSDACQPQENELRVARVCKVIVNCESGTPTLMNVDDGTECGVDHICVSGACTPVTSCNPNNVPVCYACVGGAEHMETDDPRCGTIDCDGLDRFDLRGDNTPTGSSTCVQVDYDDLTTDRCSPEGVCHQANSGACFHRIETTVATAGICQTISGCTAGNAMADTSPDGTPCGSGRTCQMGACTNTTVSSVGCADGTREGFMSVTSHPNIAACAGAWTIPGVTRTNLVPACNHAAGNTGVNQDGTGCSAADLCADGWRVCQGRAEVALHAPGGCDDAVPPGTPDKALFFAVGQASTANTACDTSGNDNDVFGCGNLGTMLTADRNCAPLNRALASTQPNACGYNEAEPNLGPWQCLGGADSHLHEGALVSKNGCPSSSCTYDGQPVANWDKGGVLCCLN